MGKMFSFFVLGLDENLRLGNKFWFGLVFGLCEFGQKVLVWGENFRFGQKFWVLVKSLSLG